MSRRPTSSRIRLKRCSIWWRRARIVSLVYLAFLAYLGLYAYLPFLPIRNVYDAVMTWGNKHWPMSYIGLGLTGFVALSLLVRPRYLILAQERGLIVYALPILGHRHYFYVEVSGIRLEVDMSEVLLKLDSTRLFRLYLKLHSGKRLLIVEETDETKVNELCAKLQNQFNIATVEHIRRVGRKSGEEINLGDYWIEKELSHGGMGKVFLARDKKTQARVALKILPACFALEQRYVSGFAREIQILQKLSHPSIVKILSFGREAGPKGDVYFYAMEFIEGRPLVDFIDKKQLDYRVSAQFTMSVALALDYLHNHGVVHRDIKPSNIMIRNNGSIVLIDFGIARTLLRQMPSYTGSYSEATSQMSGTPPYMSPEQISGKEVVDYRTDLYALGVTLYEMLTGERPFKGGNITMCRSILNWYPPEPSKLMPEIPHDLDIIAMKALEKKKHRRYQSGAEFAEDLHRFLNCLPILSTRANIVIRAWRKLRGCFRWI